MEAPNNASGYVNGQGLPGSADRQSVCLVDDDDVDRRVIDLDYLLRCGADDRQALGWTASTRMAGT